MSETGRDFPAGTRSLTGRQLLTQAQPPGSQPRTFANHPPPCRAEVSQDVPLKRCTLSNVVLTQWVRSRRPEPLQRASLHSLLLLHPTTPKTSPISNQSVRDPPGTCCKLGPASVFIRSTQSKMKGEAYYRGHFFKILILADETSL